MVEWMPTHNMATSIYCVQASLKKTIFFLTQGEIAFGRPPTPKFSYFWGFWWRKIQFGGRKKERKEKQKQKKKNICS